MTVATLREVRLYGPLGREFGRVHRLAVGSAAEGVQALCAVLPGFERAFVGRPGQPPRRYHVFVGRGAQRESIALAQAGDPVGVSEPICIVPVIEGAKKGGLFQIILGAALLVFAPAVAGALFGAGTAFGTSAAIGLGTYSASVGQALILGGLIQLLSPQRKASVSERPENLPSYGFDSGPVNTTQQGLPVPLAFGRVVIGSAQVSAGLSTDDLVAAAGAPAITPNTLPGWMRLNPYDAP